MFLDLQHCLVCRFLLVVILSIPVKCLPCKVHTWLLFECPHLCFLLDRLYITFQCLLVLILSTPLSLIYHLYQAQAPENSNNFWLQFVRGNISRCNGCGKRDIRDIDGKARAPPLDMCVQHKEYVLFENPRTGMHQMSKDLRNVHYHAKLDCFRQKYPTFQSVTCLKVSGEVRSKLSQIHLGFLLSEFGLSFHNHSS